MESYQSQLRDPTTSKERRKELDTEVQRHQLEMEINKNVIVNIERKLQGVDLENEGNSGVSYCNSYLGLPVILVI